MIFFNQEMWNDNSEGFDGYDRPIDLTQIVNFFAHMTLKLDDLKKIKGHPSMLHQVCASFQSYRWIQISYSPETPNSVQN